jgi:hypothetical protein
MKQIPLSRNGKNKGKYVAIVDDGDFAMLSQYNWSAAKCYSGIGHELIYAIRSENKKQIYMHREIMGISDGRLIDHKDGDGLNNTRTNLVISNHSDNGKNSFLNRFWAPYMKSK